MARTFSLTLLVASLLGSAFAGECTGNEFDLCPNNKGAEADSAGAKGPGKLPVALALLMVSPRARPWACVAMVLALPYTVLGADGDVDAAAAGRAKWASKYPQTCGDVLQAYGDQDCCGQGETQAFSVGSCPYNFEKPACADAEPQSPRDMTYEVVDKEIVMTGEGLMVPKAIVLSNAQGEALPLVNVHFHQGAEHKTNGANSDADRVAFDAADRRLAGDKGAHPAVRPGWMCDKTGLTADETADYTFKYCKDTDGNTQLKTGNTYEVHYVHSSAGFTEEDINVKAMTQADAVGDGLGGAAHGRGQLNPFVVVEAMIFQVVADAGEGVDDVKDLLNGWHTMASDGHAETFMYAGSTTGPSHNNEVCSPYTVSWHVDTRCHKVSAASFDNMCKQMKETYGLYGDLYPHGSRILVDKKYVVPKTYVTKLA